MMKKKKKLKKEEEEDTEYDILYFKKKTIKWFYKNSIFQNTLFISSIIIKKLSTFKYLV
jgi:hypothetical protein